MKQENDLECENRIRVRKIQNSDDGGGNSQVGKNIIQLNYLGINQALYLFKVTMEKSNQTKTPSISSFIVKLQTLLQTSQQTNIINWNQDGDALIVDCHSERIEELLGEYFNHNRMSSFIRQLNLYGFRKVSQKGQQVIYQHSYFTKGNSKHYHLIKRKRKTPRTKQINNPLSTEDNTSVADKSKNKIEKLDDILSRVKKDNERINNEITEIKNHHKLFHKIRTSHFFKHLKSSSLTDHMDGQTTKKIVQQKTQNKQFDDNPFAKSDKNITLPYSPNSIYEQKLSEQQPNHQNQSQENSNYPDSLSNNESEIINEDSQLFSSRRIFQEDGIDQFFWKQEDAIKEDCGDQ